MAIGVGDVAGTGKTVAVGPGVLSIVGAHAAAEFREGPVLVEVQNRVRTHGVFIRRLQDVPGIGT